MSDHLSKPNLSLAQPPGKLRPAAAGLSGLRWLVPLQLLVMAWLCWKVHSLSNLVGDGPTSQRATDHLRTTAIALEDRGLTKDAAEVWREYLQSSREPTDHAEVLYRIGRLSLDAEDYHQAARALIEAEQFMADNESLRSKVGPKIVECLRRLGQFGEVGRELSRQTEVTKDGPKVQAKVLASFAGENFTEADLGRAIERQVDRMLALQPDGGFGLPREQLLKQFQSPEMRQRTFQDILQRELFSRRARELKLDREETFQQSRDHIETDLLAQSFLNQELKSLQPTEVDIQSFYTANQANYSQPESAMVFSFPIPADETAANELLAKIQSSEDFRKLADEANGDAELTPTRLTSQQRHPVLGDVSKLFELKVDEWTKAPHQGIKGKYWVLIDSKTPASVPPLSEIESRVAADYRQRKEQELTQRLFQDLASRYAVKLLAMPGAEPPSAAEPTGTEAPKEDAKSAPPNANPASKKIP